MGARGRPWLSLRKYFLKAESCEVGLAWASLAGSEYLFLEAGKPFGRGSRWD